jgi:hypothetical protein
MMRPSASRRFANGEKKVMKFVPVQRTYRGVLEIAWNGQRYLILYRQFLSPILPHTDGDAPVTRHDRAA